MNLSPHYRKHPARWAVLTMLIVLLGACGEAHVIHRDRTGNDRSARAVPVTRHAGAGEVGVIRGDTLYGIAFRNGMDFRELAAINRIEPPYTIYVGQVLKLRGNPARQSVRTAVGQTSPRQASGAPVRSPNTAVNTGSRSGRPATTAFEPVSTPSLAHDVTLAGGTPSNSVNPAQAAATPTVSPPSNAAHIPSASAVVVPHIAPAPPGVAATPSAAILPADVATVGGVHWRWPARGTLLDRFMAGDATRQGIDIGGKAGDPVVAASDGTVVYSGSGLVGYGELIIIKHSDEWLSAYGHNRKRLVSEGQRVKAGQPIAEMGNTGAQRDELHFEIRRNGRPVDPQQYLPSK